MSTKNKEDKQGQVNLLKDSIFDDGTDIIFNADDTVIDDEVENNQDDVVSHDEITGEPTNEEEKKEPEKVAPTKKPVKFEAKEVTKVEEEAVEEQHASQIAVVASFLGESGIVDYDPEKFEDSEEGLRTLVKDSISKGIDEYKKSKPEDIQLFLDFVDAGGDPRKFHEVYYNSTSWEKFEVKDDNSAKYVVEEYLRSRGDGEEEIKEKIEVFETGGILEKEAKRNLARLQKEELDNKATLLEHQKRYDDEQREMAKKEYEEFKKDFYSKEELNGFKLTPAVKDKLWGFMTSSDKKTGLTPLQKHNQENTNAQYLYAYLAMNNWNLETLLTKEKTKIHSELADKLRNSTKDSRSKIKSGQQDSFTDEKTSSGFSLFRQALENNKI